MPRGERSGSSRTPGDGRGAADADLRGSMQFEQILEGFVFLEAPRVDDDDNLYFSEIMEGGVHRLSPSGKLDSYVTDRKSIGGLVLTEDGGFICSGGVGLEYFNPGSGE